MVQRLEGKLTKRMSHDLQFLVSYTFSGSARESDEAGILSSFL